MRFDPVVPAETLRLLLCDLTSKLAADNQAQSGPGRPRLRGARRSASDACSPCKRARVSEPARCAKSEVASELPDRSGRRGRVTPALRAWSLEQSTALTVPEAEWLAFPHGGPALTAVVADDADAPAEHRPDRPGVAGTGDQPDQPQQGDDGQIGRRVGVEPPAGGGGRRS